MPRERALDAAARTRRLFQGVARSYQSVARPLLGGRLSSPERQAAATALQLAMDARARAIHAALRNRLPGFLVPRLAREEPGEGAKTVLAG